MDAIKFYGLESLFDTQLTSEIKPVLARTKTTNEPTNTFENITNIVDELNHSLSRSYQVQQQYKTNLQGYF
jgi:hypothetical protein